MHVKEARGRQPSERTESMTLMTDVEVLYQLSNGIAATAGRLLGSLGTVGSVRDRQTSSGTLVSQLSSTFEFREPRCGSNSNIAGF